MAGTSTSEARIPTPTEKIKRIEPRQKEFLVEFMEQHDLFSQQKLLGRDGRQVAKRLWEDLTNELNKLGPRKEVGKWQRVWTDLKNHTKKKAAQVRRHQQATGGGPPSPTSLTPLEERILGLLAPEAVFGIEDGDVPLDSGDPQSIIDENTPFIIEGDEIQAPVMIQSAVSPITLSPSSVPASPVTVSVSPSAITSASEGEDVEELPRKRRRVSVAARGDPAEEAASQSNQLLRDLISSVNNLTDAVRQGFAETTRELSRINSFNPK